MKQTRFTKMLVAGAACAVALSTAFAQETTTTATTGTGGTGVSTTTSGTTGTGVTATTGTTGTGVTATTSTDASTTTSTSTLSGTGTLTAAPGSDYLMFRTESSTTPTRYYYSKNTTVVDPSGATVAVSALRPDMPVSYTYVKEGDRMVISKITLAKPVAEYEKTTTTTTTTKP